MSTLPHEILLLVFHQLSRDELLQCQLTCKQWCETSLVVLYKSLVINSKGKAVLYVRTVSKSPELGRYLKNIHIYNVFNQSRREGSFDEHSVLGAVIQHCPNIIDITYDVDIDPQFWTHLMHAATQGQLTKLKSLPRPPAVHLRSYIYTALLFKNSLERLWLFDRGYSFGPQLAGLEAYQMLCDQIDQFKNLRSLVFSFQSDRRLSYFDGLIEKCQHLKKLTLDLRIDDIPPPNEPETVIRPRPDIHTFECNWRMINTESQLEYVMRKFPNLKRIEIVPEKRMRSENCLNDSLIKFIPYVLSIPYFNLEIDLGFEVLLIIWANLMERKKGPKRLIVAYQSRNSWNHVMLSSKFGTRIFFPLDADVNGEPPHIPFFSKVGEAIQSLVVNMSDSSSSIDSRDIISIDWLFDIFQRCPLMEEVTIIYPQRLSPSLRILKYPSVKKLEIKLGEYSNSNNILDYLLFSLPNLHQLSFDVSYTILDYTEPIVLYMPHTSLDLLTWNETSDVFRQFRDGEVFIKLKTDAGTRFYRRIGNTLLPTDAYCYEVNTISVRFDISCKQLKELRVRRDSSPAFVANLVF